MMEQGTCGLDGTLVFRRLPPGPNDRELLILMEGSRERARRLRREDDSLPRWFAAPLIEAFGPCRVSRRAEVIARHVLTAPAGSRATLVFNVGAADALLGLLPRGACNLISLYQWLPLERLPLYKRILYRRLLAVSRVIVTYSRASVAYLAERFPGRPVLWVGHFTDTEFFDPARCRAPRGDFLLCPGDHKRVEPVVAAIGAALRRPVIRFSADPRVAAHYAAHPSSFVTCLTGIPFTEVRRLYATAAAVINVVDDSLWPVGITAFAEALAMNAPMVTSGGHSCSGYVDPDGGRPYLTVADPFDTDAWLAAVREVIAAPPPGARALALRYCSLDAMTASWAAVRDQMAG